MILEPWTGEYHLTPGSQFDVLVEGTATTPLEVELEGDRVTINAFGTTDALLTAYRHGKELRSEHSAPADGAWHDEMSAMWREIQLVLNVISPDPRYQPLILTEDSFPVEIGVPEGEVRSRLRAYFGSSFSIPLDIPYPEFIRRVQAAYPGWPDEEASAHQRDRV